ncbi:hypothetical protein THAOC_10334, partial [Thalassiosira oceanica]
MSRQPEAPRSHAEGLRVLPYIEFKNGRTIRHDFGSSKECQAFVAAMNRDETQPSATEEAEARAERVAAELLAELGLDDSPHEAPTGEDQAKKSKKKKKRRRGTRKRGNEHYCAVANDSEKILVAAGGVCRARLLESLELAWAPCQRDATVAFSQALLEDPTPGPSGRTDDPNSPPRLNASRFRPIPASSWKASKGSQLFESNFRTLFGLDFGATRRRGGVVSYVVGQLPPGSLASDRPGSLLGSDAKGGE